MGKKKNFKKPYTTDGVRQTRRTYGKTVGFLCFLFLRTKRRGYFFFFYFSIYRKLLFSPPVVISGEAARVLSLLLLILYPCVCARVILSRRVSSCYFLYFFFSILRLGRTLFIRKIYDDSHVIRILLCRKIQ